MRERHRRRLAEREGRRRKHQQRRGAALGRHARDPCRLDAAVGPDAVDQRQPVADLVLRDGEHAALLVEAAGGDLGRMGIDRDGRYALDGGHVAQVAAEALVVDRKIFVERQQHGRDDAVGNIIRVTWHGGLLRRPPSRSDSTGRRRSRDGRTRGAGLGARREAGSTRGKKPFRALCLRVERDLTVSPTLPLHYALVSRTPPRRPRSAQSSSVLRPTA